MRVHWYRLDRGERSPEKITCVSVLTVPTAVMSIGIAFSFVSLTLRGSQSDNHEEVWIQGILVMVQGGNTLSILTDMAFRWVITVGDRWLWWSVLYKYSGFHKRHGFHNVLLFCVLYYNNVLNPNVCSTGGDSETKTTAISVRSKQNQSYQSNISQRKIKAKSKQNYIDKNTQRTLNRPILR